MSLSKKITSLVVPASFAIAASASAAQVVVAPGNLNGWQLSTTPTGGTGTASFVNGPSSPPLGSGSGQLSVGSDGNGAARFSTNTYANVLLSDITGLSYSTYTSGTNGQAPYIMLFVDTNGIAGSEDTLFFEPEYQVGYNNSLGSNPDLASTTWQTFDALAGGWWSVNNVAGAGPGTNVKTLAEIITAYSGTPRISSSSLGGLRLVAGFGSPTWDNVVGNVDNVTFATAAGSTTYDFEAPVPEPATLGALAVASVLGVGRRRRA